MHSPLLQCRLLCHIPNLICLNERATLFYPLFGHVIFIVSYQITFIVNLTFSDRVAIKRTNKSRSGNCSLINPSLRAANVFSPRSEAIQSYMCKKHFAFSPRTQRDCFVINNYCERNNGYAHSLFTLSSFSRGRDLSPSVDFL